MISKLMRQYPFDVVVCRAVPEKIAIKLFLQS